MAPNQPIERTAKLPLIGIPVRRKKASVMRLQDLLPDADVLLGLEPEELAGYLLEDLASLRRNEHRANIASGSLIEIYPPEKREACKRAIMEAWVHLLGMGLIAPEPNNQHPVYFVTRRGMELRTHTSYQDFRHASLLPRQSLHPDIGETTYQSFLRHDYETAIFQAFKAVEVAVRRAAGLPATVYGVDLMRRAFHPETGTLTDNSEPPAEREALGALFAGAIGRFKNPTSHRHVAISDPAETVEMIQFASHLLRLVEQRSRRS